MRKAAHSASEQYQPGLLGSACARYFHASRSPSQRPGFSFRERRKNGERVRATSASEAGEILVTLADRHGNHIGRDAGGKNRGSTHASLWRRDLHQIAMTNAQTLAGLRI